MLIAIGQAAAILGISKKSLRILDRKGIIPAVRTHGGHRRFDKKGISEFYERGEYIVNKTTSTGIAAVYGRVSTHRQKEDLGRQIDFLSDSAREDGFTPKIYKDIGSGLNDKRKGIRKLIRDALTEFKDELKYYCSLFNYGVNFVEVDAKYTSAYHVLSDMIFQLNPNIVEHSRIFNADFSQILLPPLTVSDSGGNEHHLINRRFISTSHMSAALTIAARGYYEIIHTTKSSVNLIKRIGRKNSVPSGKSQRIYFRPLSIAYYESGPDGDILRFAPADRRRYAEEKPPPKE